MMENVKAVIFDLDNTLLDRVSTFRNFVISLLKTYMQHEDEAIMHRIIELDQDGYKDKRQLFAELLEELDWVVKPNRDELMSYYEEHYVKNALLMEHAVEIMAYARQKYKLGLITNGRTSIQYGKIDQLGIRNSFDAIIVSEEAGIKKPDARIFQMTSEILNVAPAQCLYIGDHPINDIEGAGKAGMHTIWFQVNQPWKEEVSVKPKFTIQHLQQLESIL